MNKSIIIFLFSLLFAETSMAEIILDYPIKGKSGVVSYTGVTNVTNYMIGYGEYQNLAISPNYFISYTFVSEAFSHREFKTGIFRNQLDTRISFLEPSVKNPIDDITSNMMMRLNYSLEYGFNIPLSVVELKLNVGPYVKLSGVMGLYNQIDNIMVQSYFNLNMGASIRAYYKIANIVRIGMDYTSFLIGVDYGRNGYNKDFIPDLTLINWGNYLDMKFLIYLEVDLSRVESIALGYSHGAFSVFDDINTIVSGENRIGISYSRKFFR